MYGAVTVPCATTLMVVNIGQTEAKVEALFNSFIQLREEDNFGDGAGVHPAAPPTSCGIVLSCIKFICLHIGHIGSFWRAMKGAAVVVP